MERIIGEIREDLDRRIAVAAERLADRSPDGDPACAVYVALLGRAALRERVHHLLRQIVDGLVREARGLPPELGDARADGELRARQGLPLDSLLRVYRLCGRLLWQVLTEAVAARDRAALPRLLPGAPALWDVVDRMADAAAESYRRAEAVRADRERELRGPCSTPCSTAAVRRTGPPSRRGGSDCRSADGSPWWSSTPETARGPPRRVAPRACCGGSGRTGRRAWWSWARCRSPP